MAVYTEVSASALADFLDTYDIGTLTALKGIAEGVENSNFLLGTTAGRYILTLYEKRVAKGDLPFFVALLEHLAKKGITCPQPVANCAGAALSELCGRPAAIMTFLEGVWIADPQPQHCRALGEVLAKLHLAVADFPLGRPNPLSVAGWHHLLAQAGTRADSVVPGIAAEAAAALDGIEARWPQGLPGGVVHADLFPDNVFFLGDRLSGVIDFYFACTDFFAYDLSICLNAWCFDADHRFDPARSRALMEGYTTVRPLSAAEAAALPVLARGSALRFMLTRLVDWLNVPPGALVKPKDPREYLLKLRFHAAVEDARIYGLAV